ncbi:MAG: CopD family protein [Balneolales bacterium]
MRTIYLISVYIHLLAMMVWLGGMAFMAMIVIPVTRKKMFRSMSAGLIRTTGERFRPVAWVCLSLLLVSGIFMLGSRGFSWADLWTGRLFQGTFGLIFAHKLVFFGVILFISGIHDFYLGPKAARLLSGSADQPVTGRFRKLSSWAGRINMLLGLIVVMLGVMLVRGTFG